MVGEAARRRRRPSSAATAMVKPSEQPIEIRSSAPTLNQRLRYRFDGLLSRGPFGVIVLLLVATLGFVLVASLIFAIAGMHYGGDKTGFAEDFWQSMLRVLDSGTFASDVQWPVRVVALVVTLSGIFIASALIGVISTGFEQRLDALRRGRSPVIERGHTLILGWSPRAFSTVSEIIVANESRRRPAIVILAEGDKPALDDELESRLGDLRGTRLVVRTGDPSSPADLERVAIDQARSIVVLADETGEGDAGAVKAALAAHSLVPDPDVPIVVELASEATSRALLAACGSRLVPVHADDIIAKVAAQACYQAGLGAVYRELLDFDGDEIYSTPAFEAAGRTFGDLLLAYDGCTLLGIQHADGSLDLAPVMDLVIAASDRLLVVTEDDSAIGAPAPAGPEVAPAPAAPTEASVTAPAMRLLIVGWSDLGARIIRALDALMGGSATMQILVEPALVGAAEVVLPPSRMSIEVVADSAIVDIDGDSYDQIFVLGYRGRLSPSDADARTLLTLVTLNRKFGELAHRPRIVAEVLESRTVPLAATTAVDDFVVSDELASLLISQLAENPALANVFEALFADGGPTIVMQPAEHFLKRGDQPWTAIVVAMKLHGDIALGYRTIGQPVVVNPAQSATVAIDADLELILLTRRPVG